MTDDEAAQQPSAAMCRAEIYRLTRERDIARDMLRTILRLFVPVVATALAEIDAERARKRPQ